MIAVSEYLRIFNQGGELLCVADNAEYGYADVFNDLDTGSFTLPARDPVNVHCAAHNLVEMPDGDAPARLFRILQMPAADIANASGQPVREYQVEHVAATLLDDLLFGYHEIGGTGVYTADVMRWILSHQTVRRWQFGACEFNAQFQYKFENNDLLTALLSLGNVLSEPFEWDFDTTTSPWTVSLRRADSAAGCGIHYQRNMVGITKSMDATHLATRLYCLGYGEGINQLTIKEVNGGLPYVEADTVSVWGVKSAPYTDTTIESAATLKACALAALERCKNPAFAYIADAIDWSALTGFSWDRYKAGKLVRVMDDEDGVSFDARIVRLEKRSVRGAPRKVQITISNAIHDVSDSLTALATRVGINELYSQGATIFCPYNFADNASPEKPAKFKVLIPTGCVRINQMPLKWELEPFRAYETGAAAGGASVSTSSASGGGTRTSSAGGDVTLTEPQRIYAGAIEMSNPIDDNGDNITWTGENIDGRTTDQSTGRTGTPVDNYGGAMTATSITDAYNSGSSTASHKHTIGSHMHSVSGDWTGATSPSCSTSDNTSHTHTIGAHSHGFIHRHSLGSHTHGIAAHQHGMLHKHGLRVSITIPKMELSIPSHTHSVTTPAHSHDVTLNDHTHDIQYGIYEGGTADDVTIRVDGVSIPTHEGSEVDVAAYLSTDQNGKITRGTMHTIEIVPDRLTRISATLFVQMFVQSVGGAGNY